MKKCDMCDYQSISTEKMAAHKEAAHSQPLDVSQALAIPVTRHVNPLAVIKEATRVRGTGKDLISLTLDKIHSRNQERVVRMIEGHIQRLDYLNNQVEFMQKEIVRITAKLNAINNGEYTLDYNNDITYHDKGLNDATK